MCGVCVECLIGKQNKPTLFKVTEPSSVPYRAPSASRFSETTLSCIVNISRNKRFSVYRGRHALNHTSLAPREYRQQHMLLLGLALRSFLGLPENMFDHRVKIWPLHRNCFRGLLQPLSDMVKKLQETERMQKERHDSEQIQNERDQQRQELEAQILAMYACHEDQITSSKKENEEHLLKVDTLTQRVQELERQAECYCNQVCVNLFFEAFFVNGD